MIIFILLISTIFAADSVIYRFDPYFQCQCSQYLSEADCDHRKLKVGCAWNGTACNVINCRQLPLKECDLYHSCALTKSRTCEIFSGRCADYQGTAKTCQEKGDDCIASDVQNLDGSFACRSFEKEIEPLITCGMFGERECGSHLHCTLYHNGTCIDTPCTNYVARGCQYAFQSSTGMVHLCWTDGSFCYNAINTSHLNATTCNTATWNTHTWSTTAKSCTPCHKFISSASIDILILSLSILLLL